MLSYFATLIVFGILDGLWLWTMSGRIYRPNLGDILLTDLRLGPAIALYLAYSAGLTHLRAVSPTLRSGDWSTALINGAMLGAFAYGTYDLTNHATLRNWTFETTLIDMAYGTAVASVSSLTGFPAVRLENIRMRITTPGAVSLPGVLFPEKLSQQSKARASSRSALDLARAR